MPASGREALPSNVTSAPSATTWSSPAAATSGTSENVAVTDFAASIVTWHEPVPEQPEPLQPAKLEVPSATASSVTVAFWAKSAEQVDPQSMPDGSLVTVPFPLPSFVTLSVWGSIQSFVTGVARLACVLAPVSERRR